MRDILREIQENLDAIEQKYNVKILLAVESGSRADRRYEGCHRMADD